MDNDRFISVCFWALTSEKFVEKGEICYSEIHLIAIRML
jgi:uncharacterized membrane protein YwzB